MFPAVFYIRNMYFMDENDISENKELISVWNRLSREQQKSMIALMKSMV